MDRSSKTKYNVHFLRNDAWYLLASGNSKEYKIFDCPQLSDIPDRVMSVIRSTLVHLLEPGRGPDKTLRSLNLASAIVGLTGDLHEVFFLPPVVLVGGMVFQPVVTYVQHNKHHSISFYLITENKDDDSGSGSSKQTPYHEVSGDVSMYDTNVRSVSFTGGNTLPESKPLNSHPLPSDYGGGKVCQKCFAYYYEPTAHYKPLLKKYATKCLCGHSGHLKSPPSWYTENTRILWFSDRLTFTLPKLSPELAGIVSRKADRSYTRILT